MFLGGVSAIALSLAVTQPAPESELDIEHFLRTAKIVSHDDVGVGVTRPLKLELSDGEVTRWASWKTVDIYRPGITRFADGTFVKNFTDSYRHEIAAYELDKLIGTGLVPPAVERRWRAEVGAVQLWIEDAMTDFERRKQDIPVPDPLRWNRQVYNLQLFRALTHDIDYKNARNTLIDPDWRIWAIDSSRAFRTETELIDNDLDHFSRAVLDRLASLDFDTLDKRLGKWLSDDRIRALLARRDRLLELADRLVAERGEGAVLVP